MKTDSDHSIPEGGTAREEEAVTVFLHGFTGSGRDFSVIASGLAPLPCLMPDLPGHGENPLPTTPGFRAVLDNLSGWIHSRKQPLAGLCGYSLGGRLALALVAEGLASPQKLILESTSAGLKTEEERKQRANADAQWQALLSEGDAGSFFTRWYRQPVFAGFEQTSGISAFLREKMESTGPDQLRRLAESLNWYSIAGQPDYHPSLKKLSLPVLLICGDRDEKYISIMTEMKNEIPGSELVILRGGHNLHLENPADFSAVVSEFLRV